MKLFARIFAIILLLGAIFFALNIYLNMKNNNQLNIVAFVDYNDLNTYKSYRFFAQAIKQYPDVNVVIRPIAKDINSYNIAIFMDAAFIVDGKNAQILNEKILSRGAPITLNQIKDIANEMGMDVVGIERQAAIDISQKNINNNAILFGKVGIKTPPVFLIGNNNVYNPDKEKVAGINQWIMMIDDAKKKGE